MFLGFFVLNSKIILLTSTSVTSWITEAEPFQIPLEPSIMLTQWLQNTFFLLLEKGFYMRVLPFFWVFSLAENPNFYQKRKLHRGNFKAKMSRTVFSGHISMATGHVRRSLTWDLWVLVAIFLFCLWDRKIKIGWKPDSSFCLPWPVVVPLSKIPWAVSLSEHLMRDMFDVAVGAHVHDRFFTHVHHLAFYFQGVWFSLGKQVQGAFICRWNSCTHPSWCVCVFPLYLYAFTQSS